MAVALLGALLLSGCGTSNSSTGTSSAGASTQKVSSGSTNQGSQASKKAGAKIAPKENHPTGDIPDTQAFVTYTSNKGHYKLVAPEGWSRTASKGNVSFVNKLDGLSVTLESFGKAPTVTSVRKNVVPRAEEGREGGPHRRSAGREAAGRSGGAHKVHLELGPEPGHRQTDTP